MDINYLGEMSERISEEKTYNDIFMMRLWGADPMESPYYRDFIVRKQNEIKETQAVLSDESAKAYSFVYDTVLNEKKNANKIKK